MLLIIHFQENIPENTRFYPEGAKVGVFFRITARKMKEL